MSFLFLVCQDFRTRKITSNGEHAAEMFSLVERLTPVVVPFTWLFIRPPWATTGACCKECVFNNMLNIVKVGSRSVNTGMFSINILVTDMKQVSLTVICNNGNGQFITSIFLQPQVRNESKLNICVAKIYQLLDEQTDNNDNSRTEKHLQAAAGNLYANFLHWQIKYKNMVCLSFKGKKNESIFFW